MHVSKVETTDDLILNSELAHVFADEGEVHLFKGRQAIAFVSCPSPEHGE